MKKYGKLNGYNRADIVFYVVLMAFPVLQFCIFYIGVNFNSMLLAFQKFDVSTNTMSWVGMDNLIAAFQRMFTTSEMLNALGYSFLAFVISIFVGTPLSLLFSFYIYKKLPGSKLFRVLLFLPSVISAIVMVTIFQFFVERAVPELVLKLFHTEIGGLIENKDTRFATIMFYNVVMGFGVSTIMYANAMSGIAPELTEAAKLEGVYGIREFFYITFPLIYPTVVTFLVVGVAGIFTNQINLYSFFGEWAPSNTVTYGYWLYIKAAMASKSVGAAEYPELAAIGIWLTLVAVPLTLIVKYLLEKFGPSEK